MGANLSIAIYLAKNTDSLNEPSSVDSKSLPLLSLNLAPEQNT